MSNVKLQSPAFFYHKVWAMLDTPVENIPNYIPGSRVANAVSNFFMDVEEQWLVDKKKMISGLRTVNAVTTRRKNS